MLMRFCTDSMDEPSVSTRHQVTVVVVVEVVGVAVVVSRDVAATMISKVVVEEEEDMEAITVSLIRLSMKVCRI